MVLFAKATLPARPLEGKSRIFPILLVGIIVGSMLAQLFTFDEFIVLYADSGSAFLSVFPSIIVVLELLSLPFLLQMALSPAFRWLSMVSGWAVVVLWVVAMVVLSNTAGANLSVGFFGTVIDTPLSLWSGLLFGLVGVLVAYTSYLLWPLRGARRKAARKKSVEKSPR